MPLVGFVECVVVTVPVFLRFLFLHGLSWGVVGRAHVSYLYRLVSAVDWGFCFSLGIDDYIGIAFT